MADDRRVRIARARQAQMRARNDGPRYPNLSQVNRGIADSVGGVVDLINPFDPWTGSAKDGLRSLMERGGVDVAEGEPEGWREGMMRGAGAAAGALIPGAAGARAVGALPGALGGAGRDAAAALTTRTGAGLEVASGGAAGAAETATREAGYGEAAQMAAAIGAGAAAPAAFLSVPGVAKATATAMPITGRAISGAQRALAPYTKEGATNVARRRVQGLAGGEERAEAMAARIDRDSPLTPAQQTEDDALIGLERAAAEADPTLADRLAQKESGNLSRIRGEVESFGEGASVEATKDAVRARREVFRERLAKRVETARTQADQRLAALGPQRTETDDSLIVADEIRKAFAEAKATEDDLWRRVPQEEVVGTYNARGAFGRIVEETPRSQADDIPARAARFLGEDGEYGPAESVAEMHGLYSALREEARNAMAGTQQNRNRARIANKLADAILTDLDAINPTSAAGRSILVAREFSREMHEQFDQGSVGRLLRRTANSDEQIPPELTLDRTVARGGSSGARAYDDIGRAVGEGGETKEAVEDFLRRRFGEAAFTSDDQFSERGARTFIRNNAEVLARFPELRQSFGEAVGDKVKAEALAGRGTRRIAQADAVTRSAGARFVESSTGKEVDTIFRARNPAAFAREVVRQARGDTSGEAVRGLKGALARHLIEGATPKERITAVNLREALRDPRTMGVIRQAFDEPEITRLRRMGDELAKLEKARGGGAEVGSVSNVEPPKAIAFILRTFAARQGARLGQGTSGASLLTANFATRRMQEIMDGLTNDRAARIISDAIEDPELFRSLLLDPASKAQSERIVRSLAPYVLGAAAASAD